jgi:hypothetical protein
MNDEGLANGPERGHDSEPLEKQEASESHPSEAVPPNADLIKAQSANPRIGGPAPEVVQPGPSGINRAQKNKRHPHASVAGGEAAQTRLPTALDPPEASQNRDGNPYGHSTGSPLTQGGSPSRSGPLDTQPGERAAYSQSDEQHRWQGAEPMTQARLVADELRLLRRVKKVAWEEWLRGRSQTRIPAFNSKSAKSKVVEFTEQALRTEDERDVLQAVHELSRDANGAPWDIPKAAMRIGANRRELERLDRKIQEREVGQVVKALAPKMSLMREEDKPS